MLPENLAFDEFKVAKEQMFFIYMDMVSPLRTFEQFLLIIFEQFSSRIWFHGISNDDFLLGIE